MGREAGHLAMHSGVAGAVDAILTPEIPYSLDGIWRRVAQIRRTEGRNYFVMVASEGAGAEKGRPLDRNRFRTPADYIAGFLEDKGVIARADSLGHAQRGSVPNAEDRQLAARMGTFAVDALKAGARLEMVALRNGALKRVDMSAAKEHTRRLDPASDIVRAARELGIYIGEIA
jgi:6-phosphofructokinase 1